jgi:glutathione S-transferase
MSSVRYKIIGRSGAGSLIAEFLLTEIGVDYEVIFTNPKDFKTGQPLSAHPQGKIPTLICPNETPIFETLAIINHITDRFGKLAPMRLTPIYDRYWQFLSLMATSIYPAYHRQHHSKYYIKVEGYESLRENARKEQTAIYDYIETELDPYVCGELLTAADLYLYMLMRWDIYKDALYDKRPKLKALNKMIRTRPSVVRVLESQPNRKK